MTLKEGRRSTVEWEEVRADFAPDGSWRDVYVFGTSTSDWQAFLDLIRERRLPMRFSVDGEDAELPEEVTDVFTLGEAHRPLLRVSVTGLDLNCHFFKEDELELDIDPETIDENGLKELVDFMMSLGGPPRKDAW